MNLNEVRTPMWKYNGRVDIVTPDPHALFAMKSMSKIPAKQCATYRDALEGIWDENMLSKAFFSQQNIQILQNGVRAAIYEKSNKQYVVAQQSCDQLDIIMRSIFLQHAANQPDNITQQIVELNKIVIDDVVQRLYGEVQGYLKYLYDASTLVVPIAHPVMANNTDRELEFTSWFSPPPASSTSKR